MEALKFFFLSILVVACSSQNFGRFVNTFERIRDSGEILDSYDFVVIGAGSGGSVVANRLTENPSWNVLLLEAGQDEGFMTDVPLAASLQGITGYNWGYKGRRIKSACLGAVQQRCNLPRGKALGGTSVINFLIYTRGNRQDYDGWESLGNHGWGFRDVLPYFIKSENCSSCEDIDASYHGYDGYLNVENPGYESPLVKSFIKSGVDLGYKNVDTNGASGLGFSRVQATMRQGARCSASKAFLKPVRHRGNLHISTSSQVTKILINPDTKTAYGVEFVKNNVGYRVLAKKEVILSAGSFNSPQLLMLSGVGPKEHLEDLGIPVMKDLKVGFNLQDHAALSTLAFLVNESITVSDFGVQNPVHIFNYLWNGKGPYTIPGGAEALGFVKTKLNRRDDDDPDIELVLGSGALNGDIFGAFRSLLGIPNNVFDTVYRPVVGKPAFGIATVLMRPKSRGRVMLKSRNPMTWPLIYPNYFQEEADLWTMVEGIKIAINLTRSQHFQRYSARLHKISMPNCENHQFGSDSYWACVLRNYGTSLGHQVGTCKMGPKGDQDAVVDPELKVHGINGLRVVDGSIMPNVVAGHTNAVVFMIGEKASDMIKREWGMG
ncbi:glucose dehydrogenase [FAD, quinone]-like [Coccinella septempunctata]|uniref:glucose dehydrogenase [FAD, quinone]-like n=1 Tax=Coccinella septempunctata TaxID=41139 RepID=UPI001D05DC9F|nr:glucose dehydrogenase [FAD, quinone]-like [Coccinella septempunctata]